METMKRYLPKDLPSPPIIDLERGDPKFILRLNNSDILCELEIPFVMVSHEDGERKTIDIKILEWKSR